MPLFKPKSSSRSEKTSNGSLHQEGHDTKGDRLSHQDQSATPDDNQQRKTPLVFRCQLAHGSQTGFVSGFTNVRELYQKIAECYDISPNEILFCTLNSAKVEMSQLLGGQIGLDDFIFAHRKGRPKEIELVKSEDALGLTITDNGTGYAFIKRIKENSIIDRVKVIQVGDHIEKINSENLVGKRHFEVARMLKNIPKGSTFTLRLVEPLKSGFESIGPRGDMKKGKKAAYGSGKETLRFKADGSAEIQQIDKGLTLGIERINLLLESYIGIQDSDLVLEIFQLTDEKDIKNSMDFADAIDNSDLAAFGFTDDFIIELWGVITDVRSGRLR